MQASLPAHWKRGRADGAPRIASAPFFHWSRERRQWRDERPARGQRFDSVAPPGSPIMGGLFWLTKAQMRLISPHFPLSHGVARVDDRRVVSGIVFVLKSGLRWRDAPTAYGPRKTLVQPLHPLEPHGRAQPHLRRTGRSAGDGDDRRDPPEGRIRSSVCVSRRFRERWEDRLNSVASQPVAR